MKAKCSNEEGTTSSNLDYNILNILIKAIHNYSRNNWTREGRPYHEMWMREKKYKQLNYNKGQQFVQKSPNKTKVVPKAKPVVLPSTETELENIRKELKRYYKNYNPDDEENMTVIGRLLRYFLLFIIVSKKYF